MKNLILLGGGGHCKSVIDVAESAGFTILGVLDKPEMAGQRILNYSVIGTDDDIPSYVDKALFLITVGQIKSNTTRVRLAKLVQDVGGKFATVIAKDANVSQYATIGEGTVIMHNAVVNADAKIGEQCIINTMADIEHDVKIGDFCHISTAAVVNGEVKIGNNVFVGSGTIVHNGKSITDDVVVSAGSVVSRNLDKSGVYAGNPVKFYKI